MSQQSWCYLIKQKQNTSLSMSSLERDQTGWYSLVWFGSIFHQGKRPQRTLKQPCCDVLWSKRLQISMSMMSLKYVTYFWVELFHFWWAKTLQSRDFSALCKSHSTAVPRTYQPLLTLVNCGKHAERFDTIWFMTKWQNAELDTRCTEDTDRRGLLYMPV